MAWGWRRRRAAVALDADVDALIRDAWRLVYEGYAYTALRCDDDERARVLRQQLGDMIYTMQQLLVALDAEHRERLALQSALARAGS